jgi:hypothetical protein
MLDLREMMALLDEASFFGDELRAKLHDWAVKLHTRDNPNLTDDDELKSVLLWVKSLVMVSWDISGSVFVLASGDNLDRVPRSGVRVTLDAGWASAGDDR